MPDLLWLWGGEIKSDGTTEEIFVELPKQPIPEMQEMLQSFLTAVACISTPEELEKTKQHVQEFMDPDSPGRQLHDRFVKFASDPSTDNWFSDILVKKNYFGTHPVMDGVQPTAVERAATVSLAALKCKKSLEAGEITADVIAENTLDMNSYNGLFNVYREPYQGQDRIRKFDGYDHIVAFKNGLAFKVPVKEVTWHSLKATFEEIIRTAEGEQSGIPALTMDKRDNWAEMRAYLRCVHPANAKFLETIETAAFTLSLDDNEPITQSERA
ncbi:carnitine O-acetyltransferase, putative [Talaromyces stipitatus ATCC 10500]|uniref:Carnitine O-acetyltransferase, putative n=1 Tax=Talaromyces stipitatus (strain ATCC 10500 / CBS 375.48 / QM 6759 / NRRL 1006) TaxID=441959 RepID=B8MHH0_TALSN|nr:carnitine O-acetyltransferase, putative [Talaromyces stipitatus ATCC 10500]EED17149.1 carnitine O-acetyltransferase, putative [Talaromyces stipitatus ATCC 10500]